MTDLDFDPLCMSDAERNFCAMQSAMGKLRESAESMKAALDACRLVSVNDLSERDLSAYCGCIDGWGRVKCDLSDLLSVASLRYVDLVLGGYFEG